MNPKRAYHQTPQIDQREGLARSAFQVLANNGWLRLPQATPEASSLYQAELYQCLLNYNGQFTQESNSALNEIYKKFHQTPGAQYPHPVNAHHHQQDLNNRASGTTIIHN